MPRTSREVVFVDGVRTPFGKAGEKGMYAQTRADDLVINCIRELMRRHPELPPERVEEVAIAATTQIGDQGLTLGRMASLLSGLPNTTPGYSVDRMCAGAMTAVTNIAGAISFGSIDVAVAGGVEHMGRHPMGEGVDPNPRVVAEKLVDPSALVMGKTAENLHDRYPTLTKERSDEFAVNSQRKLAQAYEDGKIQPDLVPTATRHADKGWGLATADEPPRPQTTLESLKGLKTPFRPHGNVTAGNAAGLNDGATACILAAEETAHELGLPVGMRLVEFAFVGVEPEVMGYGPVPAAEKALAKAGDDERKRRKIVRKKAPEGRVNWTDKTFERLRDAAPETLTSQFQVTTTMVLNLMERGGDPVAAMSDLLDRVGLWAPGFPGSTVPETAGRNTSGPRSPTR